MKKVLPILLCVLIVTSSMMCVAAKETYPLGDVTKDTIVSITDATYIQFYLAGLIDKSDDILTLGDVDGNSRVSIKDATYIQLYLVKAIDKLPGEKDTVSTPSIDNDGYYDQIVKP